MASMRLGESRAELERRALPALLSIMHHALLILCAQVTYVHAHVDLVSCKSIMAQARPYWARVSTYWSGEYSSAMSLGIYKRTWDLQM